MDLDKTKISNIEFDSIDYSDYPDFCDAFISSAYYNGVPMTQEQLDEINDDDFVYEKLWNYLF